MGHSLSNSAVCSVFTWVLKRGWWRRRRSASMRRRWKRTPSGKGIPMHQLALRPSASAHDDDSIRIGSSLVVVDAPRIGGLGEHLLIDDDADRAATPVSRATSETTLSSSSDPFRIWNRPADRDQRASHPNNYYVPFYSRPVRVRPRRARRSDAETVTVTKNKDPVLAEQAGRLHPRSCPVRQRRRQRHPARALRPTAVPGGEPGFGAASVNYPLKDLLATAEDPRQGGWQSGTGHA